MDPHLLDNCRELSDRGVLIKEQADLNSLVLDFDILLVDLITSPTSPFIEIARRTGTYVSNVADLVFQLSTVPTIGITGSSGKTTTATLLSRMMMETPINTYVAKDHFSEQLWPNVQLLKEIDEMVRPGSLIAELTSGHLEYMHASPNVSLITNITPDHVEWHGSLEDYVKAKQIILMHQSGDDIAVLNKDDPISEHALIPHCKGRMVFFSGTEEVAEGAFLKNDKIYAKWNDECEMVACISDISVNRRYIGNILAACAGAIATEIPLDAIKLALYKFDGISQRLQFVGKFSNIYFYNNGRGNTAAKVRASWEAFRGRSLHWIAGGNPKSKHDPQGAHQDASEIANLNSMFKEAPNLVKTAHLFGEATVTIRKYLLDAGFPGSRIYEASNLKDCFQQAIHNATAESVVLLSPLYGIPWDEANSFNALFEDYSRGK
jgi:UDP-N-acetylmuramoylalanine--D-glutamate ligase